MRVATVAAATAALMLALVGCGSEADTAGSDPPTGTSPTPSASPTPTPTPTAATTPPQKAKPVCEEVWKANATLPRGYTGCTFSGAPVPMSKGVFCESGQRLYTYGLDLYAGRGGRIIKTQSPLKHDAMYARVLHACTG